MDRKKLIQTIIFVVAAIGFTLLSYIIPSEITNKTHAAIWFTTGGIILSGILSYLIKNSENGFMDFTTVSYFYVFLSIVAGILELVTSLAIKWTIVIQLLLFIFYVIMGLVFMGNKKEKETYKKAG